MAMEPRPRAVLFEAGSAESPERPPPCCENPAASPRAPFIQTKSSRAAGGPIGGEYSVAFAVCADMARHATARRHTVELLKLS